jgi:DNA-binding HxlR family transcriptional regulator
MTEVLLTIIILAILAYHAWYVQEHDKQTKLLTKAVLSKDLTELNKSEIIEKTPAISKKQEEELIPFDELSDKQFDKIIKQEK